MSSLLLAMTERGLVRVAYEYEGRDRVLVALAVRISSRMLCADGGLGEASGP